MCDCIGFGGPGGSGGQGPFYVGTYTPGTEGGRYVLPIITVPMEDIIAVRMPGDSSSGGGMGGGSCASSTIEKVGASWSGGTRGCRCAMACT